MDHDVSVESLIDFLNLHPDIIGWWFIEKYFELLENEEVYSYIRDSLLINIFEK
jgi:hypothetical protein